MRIVAGLGREPLLSAPKSQTKGPARFLSGVWPVSSPLRFGMGGGKRASGLASDAAYLAGGHTVGSVPELELQEGRLSQGLLQDTFLLNTLLDEALQGFPSPASKAQVLEAFSGDTFSGEESSVPSVLRALTLLTARLHQPPQEPVRLERPRKVLVASRLSQWMGQVLERENIRLAVVTRQGGRQHRQHDPTGMLHSGIVWRDPLDGCWKIYNLVDYKATGKPHCRVLWTKPVDFFYQQGGYDPAALLLIPSGEIQQRMETLLLNGGFQRLAFTRQYNLLSPPHGPDSLNCNKWVLLNVLAAHHNTEDPAFLLREIQRNYRAEPLALDPLTRLFAGWHPQVRGKELSWWKAPTTVTVESLLKSGLFERALSYADTRSAL